MNYRRYDPCCFSEILGVPVHTRHPYWLRPWLTVHPIDFHHNHWAHMPRSYAQPNNNNGVAEQPGVPVGGMRAGGLDGDSQQQGSLPSVYGNGSGSRSRILSVPPLAPQLMRAHGNINEQYQQSSLLYAGSQLSGVMRPLGAAGPAVPPLLDNTPFSLFPPGPPSYVSIDPSQMLAAPLYILVLSSVLRTSLAIDHLEC